MSRAFVVGGGLAGLAAALGFLDRGIETTLLEASPHLGGRCRSFVDPTLGRIDNGTHALVGANTTALRLLERLGVRERWLKSGTELVFADLAHSSVQRFGTGLPGLVRAGLRGREIAGLLRLVGPDRPVAALFAADRAFYRNLIHPVTMAALNAEPGEASSRLLGAVLRQAWRGGDALAPLIAERGCGPDLIEPLARQIGRLGGRILPNTRVRGVDRSKDRVASILAGDASFELGAGDVVVLALPPTEAGRLIQRPFALATSPIVCAHFRFPAPPAAHPLFLGVLGAKAQWVLVRGDIASVTVSAADDLIEAPAAEIGRDLWAETRAALRLLGLAVPDAPLAQRVIKEKRATLRQTPGLVRHGPRTRWRNLVLAGDWTDTGLPATIEGALRSGAAAVRIALDGQARERWKRRGGTLAWQAVS